MKGQFYQLSWTVLDSPLIKLLTIYDQESALNMYAAKCGNEYVTSAALVYSADGECEIVESFSSL